MSLAHKYQHSHVQWLRCEVAQVERDADTPGLCDGACRGGHTPQRTLLPLPRAALMVPHRGGCDGARPVDGTAPQTTCT